MEAMAATTKDGTFTVAIERNKVADVGRLDLHLSIVPGDDTEWIRNLLLELAAKLGSASAGASDLSARLDALAGELERQDEGKRLP